MDENNQPIDNQNSYSPDPDTNTPHETMFFDATASNMTDENTGISVDPNFQRPAPSISSNAPSSYNDKSDLSQNSMRIGLAVLSLLFIVGAGVATMYFTKTGFFRDDSISTGNHSFSINRNEWSRSDVDETEYSITLYDEDANVTIGISDNPLFSSYSYDAQYFKNEIRQLDSKITTSKKDTGNIKCVVYGGTMSMQDVNIPFEAAICDTSKNYNVMVSVFSINKNLLDQYLDKGINIIKTGK